ncbi:hypothetical protein PN36_34645 [Candidatus Thiomargarita nelsonii]|uniref:Uncharacterized protein n=1 Tax=Candidatus Thiomargarita nelsonii TaxID=1003181 RepID=A0A0A6PCR8_9GAMM|nr:hypothetical protein PN36_34645 [Candidatus Thiomargarita nelsonii]
MYYPARLTTRLELISVIIYKWFKKIASAKVPLKINFPRFQGFEEESAISIVRSIKEIED